MASGSLLVITNNYPLGGITEEAFLRDEIPVLAETFKQVTFIPMRKETDCFDISFWPENVILDDRLALHVRDYSKKRYLKLFNWQLFVAVLLEIGKVRNRLQLEHLIRTFIEGQSLSEFLKTRIGRGELKVNDTMIYSFWFADNAVGLGLLPKNIMPQWISRAHHYDLYDERVPVRSRYFRNRAFANVKQVLCCSHQGEAYLAERYPKWKNKIDTLYLGTLKPLTVPEYVMQEKHIRFITVARMEPVKRPLQTFDYLFSLATEYPDYDIFWTVIGDGSLFEPLKRLSETRRLPNFHVDMLGSQPNSVVRALFETKVFDWMIMLSESEGLPICFAEAMSYGIPSIATNVGGVGEEIIPNVTGILLAAEPETNDFLLSIRPYIECKSIYLKLRNTAVDYWTNTLDSTKLKKELVKKMDADFDFGY